MHAGFGPRKVEQVLHLAVALHRAYAPVELIDQLWLLDLAVTALAVWALQAWLDGGLVRG